MKSGNKKGLSHRIFSPMFSFFKHKIKDRVLLIIRWILYPLVLMVNAFLKQKKLFILYRLYGDTIGDTLVMSALIKLLNEQFDYRILLVVKKYDEIFFNNPRLIKTLSYTKMGRIQRQLVKNGLDVFHGTNIARFYNSTNNKQISIKERSHMVHYNSAHIPDLLYNDYNDVKTELYLSNEEIVRFQRKYRLPEKFAIIKPTGKLSFTSKKEWGFEKFQTVVLSLSSITWIQTGVKTDPLLKGVIDLRGETNLRELFYIISKSQFVLSIEGLYNHIAAAFSKPSFVVCSGFYYPEFFMYKNTIPIIRSPQIECSPCSESRFCYVPNKPCTEDILPESVVRIINQTVGLK